ELDERQAIFAQYLTDNWRAHRTWGLSANSPWEYAIFWRLREGVARRRQEFQVDWENLQKPGFSADYTQRPQGQMAVDRERSDWIPTAAGRALIRNNQPLLAYIAGKPSSFTSKDHNFHPGEALNKQLIIINNSRETVACECTWSLGLPQLAAGSTKVSIRTGEQERIPLRFELPATLSPGSYELGATVRFDNGETQQDSFTVNVLPLPTSPPAGAKIALLDPRGETGKLLAGLKVPFESVDAKTDLSAYDVLILGKEALRHDGPGPDVGRVRQGLKVIVFEQTAQVLEERFGFRVTEYGLRQVFPRVPDHPLLAGLEGSHWRDWRGEATILAPRLKYTLRPRYGPTVPWCGIDVTRAWRCGCRGNVASVLIEKPARGDFLSILDGGYGLQYSPLLEYREGRGMVLFCQLDVTGRTQRDPAADALTHNILRYVSAWKPRPVRQALYAGDAAGKRHLEASGLTLGPYTKEELATDRVLIVGPGGGQQLASDKAALGPWLKAGGHLLAIGLDEAEAKAFLPWKVEMKKQEHIAAYFEPPTRNSLLAGIGPAEVHNRDPREIPLVSGGVAVLGNGILAQAEDTPVVFCQLVPWQFEHTKQMNLKRTFRRASGLVGRLAGNMGVSASTPLLERLRRPPSPYPLPPQGGEGRVRGDEKRWLDGLYLDVPEEWDDPYRFFRW
ncbi:MAG: hypothetical protein L0Z62_24445, partial [Gemmataceae bacterium]|nr:hypothetical protein [Gemmataceae bacterium]